MRPIVLVSNTPRAGIAKNGRSDSTASTRSVAPSSAKQLPIATSALDAKKAVPCCRPAMMPVSIILSSRRAMVCIQASRCSFIACVSEVRLTILPSAASAKEDPGGQEEGEGERRRRRQAAGGFAASIARDHFVRAERGSRSRLDADHLPISGNGQPALRLIQDDDHIAEGIAHPCTSADRDVERWLDGFSPGAQECRECVVDILDEDVRLRADMKVDDQFCVGFGQRKAGGFRSRQIS